MMASSLCLSCLKRSLYAIESPARATTHSLRAFSTTSSRSANPPKKKPVVSRSQGTRQGSKLKIKKKGGRGTPSGRPPAPGERKALRKRVVLSNTNALEVQGLQDFSAENTSSSEVLASHHGKVLGFGDRTVDALRALEAFKPTQGWNLFRRPATLVRRDTVELAQQLDDAQGGDVLRQVLFGERGSGKSVLQLQALALAHLKGWIVIHIPEAKDLTNASTSYEPVKVGDDIQYVQPHFAAQLLTNVVKANRELLSSMRLSKKHNLPVPIQPNIALDRLADLGARDAEVAWPVWQALWSELTAPSQSNEQGLRRHPILFSMDSVDHVMRDSAYLDADSQPIHAHDLALVRQFIDHLSGKSSLPNGGAVIAAVSESNRAASPTLDYLLSFQHQMRTFNAWKETQPAFEQLQTAKERGDYIKRAQPYMQSLPRYDPYFKWDERIASAFGSDIHADKKNVLKHPSAGAAGAAAKQISPKKVLGLSKEEARGVMEYYAQSGMLRASVTPTLVSEKWTLAGGGIVGEIEKGSVKLRF